jgi:hypothetical protein
MPSPARRRIEKPVRSSPTRPRLSTTISAESRFAAARVSVM